MLLIPTANTVEYPHLTSVTDCIPRRQFRISVSGW